MQAQQSEEPSPTPPPPPVRRSSQRNLLAQRPESSASARYNQSSPLHRLVRGSSQSSILVPKEGTSKASSLPHGVPPSEASYFRRTGSLPRNIKPAWKMSMPSITTTQEAPAGRQPLPTQTGQPVEVTRLVTRVRASSRTSHSSGDSGDESGPSPKHRSSASPSCRRNVSFSPDVTSIKSPVRRTRSAATLKVARSSEDFLAEIQEALDEQSRSLFTVGNDAQRQADAPSKSTSRVSGVKSPPSLSSDDAFSPSSGSDTAPECQFPGAQRERQAVTPVRRDNETPTVPDLLRRQQNREDLEMVAKIRKRYSLSAGRSPSESSTSAKPPGSRREVPTASQPYVSIETPKRPNFVPSALREVNSVGVVRTVQFPDAVIARRPVRASSARQIRAAGFFPTQQLET